MPFVPARGLRIDRAIVGFEFKPSVGILARDIDKLGQDIRSFKVPLTRSVREVMIPSIRENFEAQGRPEAWEPLAEYTQKRRAEEGYSAGGPILQRKGLLMRTMGYVSIWTITTSFATIKDLPQRIWYGKLHQSGYGSFAAVVARHGGNISAALEETGAGAKKVRIPQRQFVMIHPEDADAIQYVFSVWLGERIAGVVKRR